MKLINKGIIILLLVLSNCIISTKVSLVRRFKKSKSKSKSRLTGLEKAKFFAQGAISKFLGFDAKCFEKLTFSDPTISEPEAKALTADTNLNVAYGLYSTRTKLLEYFSDKEKEWEGGVKQFFNFWKADDKVALYNDLVKKNRSSVISIETNIIGVLIGDDEEAKKVAMDSITAETQDLHTDMVKYIDIFGGKDKFVAAVDLSSFNDLMGEYNKIDPSNKLGQIDPKKDSSFLTTIYAPIKKILTLYDTFGKSSIGCAVTAFKGIATVVKAIAENTGLFIPGLNILVVIWRAANVLKYVVLAGIDLYNAVVTVNEKEKWIGFGKALGGLIRGLVYLITGARKHKKRRMHRKRN